MKPLIFKFILSLCVVLEAASLQAETKYWDTNDVAGGAGGVTPSGTWDTATTANWTADATGASAATTWAANDDAVFSAGSDAIGSWTVTIPTGTTNFANSVTVEEGTILMGPGTLSFGAVNGVFNIVGGTNTWNISGTGSGFVTGTEGITKNGLGVLFLGGTEQYTNSSASGAFLTVNAGIADFSGETALGVVPATARQAAVTLNGGTLRYSGSAGLTLNTNRGLTIGASGGTIEMVNNPSISGLSLSSSATHTGSGNLTKKGPGRFTLGTTSTGFTGKYIVLGGALNTSSDLRLGPVPASAVPDYFTLNGSDAAVRIGVTSGVTLNANRGITLGSGGGTLMQPGPGTLTFNGIIAGTSGGALRIFWNDNVDGTGAGGGAAGGIVVLGGANTYNGATTIGAGATLRVGAAGTIPDGSAVTLTASSSALDLNALSEMIGPLVLTAGTVSNGTLTASSFDLRSGTISAALAGSGAATKTTSGTVTLTGASATYDGTIAVNAGVLAVTVTNALGSTVGNTTVASGAALQTSTTAFIAENITLNGTGVSGAGALRHTASAKTLLGAITLGSSGVRINSDASTLTLSGGISGSGNPNLTIGGAGSVTISTNALNIGGGTLTKEGAATLTLNTANTIGALAFTDGRLVLNNDAGAGTGDITISSAALAISASSALGNITVANNIVLNVGAAPVLSPASGTPITTLELAGTISGDGKLIRGRQAGTGAGVGVLSGANTFTGGVTVTSDSLVLGNK